MTRVFQRRGAPSAASLQRAYPTAAAAPLLAGQHTHVHQSTQAAQHTNLSRSPHSGLLALVPVDAVLGQTYSVSNRNFRLRRALPICYPAWQKTQPRSKTELSTARSCARALIQLSDSARPPIYHLPARHETRPLPSTKIPRPSAPAAGLTGAPPLYLRTRDREPNETAPTSVST